MYVGDEIMDFIETVKSTPFLDKVILSIGSGLLLAKMKRI